MNDMIETRAFFENLAVGNYEAFNFSDPMRNVPVLTSYHIKKADEEEILKLFFKIRLILAFDLTEVAMRKLSKNENEYGILKIVDAVQKNVFLPIVVSGHFISMYEFCSCPHIGTIDLGTEDFAARFHVPVLGYNRSINEHTCADPDTIKYVM